MSEVETKLTKEESEAVLEVALERKIAIAKAKAAEASKPPVVKEYWANEERIEELKAKGYKATALKNKSGQTLMRKEVK